MKTRSFPFSTAGSYQMPKDAANICFRLMPKGTHQMLKDDTRSRPMRKDAVRSGPITPIFKRCHAQCRNHRRCRLFPLKADRFLLSAVFTTEIPPMSAQCRSSPLKAEGVHQWPTQEPAVGHCRSVPFFTTESYRIPPSSI